jgi:hypothetical protein
MKPATLSLLALLAFVSRGEIIDRVAVAIDDQVITLSRVDEDIRVTAFLNGEKPDFSAANRRAAADRLIEQILISREMDFARYPRPTSAEVAGALDREKARFPSEQAYKEALASYGITEKDVQDALLRQSALLRFIDLRFKPEVEVRDIDVQTYYETVFLPAARRRGIWPDPPFDDVRAQCEEAVTEQLVNRRVDAWLKEARGRSRIIYEEGAFQ